MAENFQYDVFLSHSSKDTATVRDVAERLKKDGLRIWFDEWEIKCGDNIPSKIDKGLRQSRVLVLCMSANALGSDWTQLESQTFQFRDPLNKERRFIPLRFDDALIEGTLAQFRYVNWLPEKREQEYPKLLAACKGEIEISSGDSRLSGRQNLNESSAVNEAGLVKIPDWFVSQLPTEHRVAFKRNAAVRARCAGFGQPVKSLFTIFFETTDPRCGHIKLQISELAQDASGNAHIENLNVTSIGSGNIPSRIYCCLPDGTVSGSVSASLENDLPIVPGGMVVMVTGYGEPLFGAQFGHCLRDWIAVDVGGFTLECTRSIEYFFAVASERLEASITLAGEFPPFERRTLVSKSILGVAGAINNCIKNVSNLAARHFEPNYGSKAFNRLAKGPLNSFKWQTDYSHLQMKNVAYILEAPRKSKV